MRPQFWISSLELNLGWRNQKRVSRLRCVILLSFRISLLSLSLSLSPVMIDLQSQLKYCPIATTFLGEFANLAQWWHGACRHGMRWSWFGRFVNVWPISVTSSHSKLYRWKVHFFHMILHRFLLTTLFTSIKFSNPIRNTHNIKKNYSPKTDKQFKPLVTFSPRSFPWSRMDGAHQLRGCHQTAISRAITATDFFAFPDLPPTPSFRLWFSRPHQPLCNFREQGAFPSKLN